jgi:DNA helicase-2/ATP-dependent DNA helicase PcrA
LLAFNDRCQDDLVNAKDYREYVARLERDPTLKLPRVGSSKKEMPREEVLARCNEIAKVYTYVTEMLKSKGWGTFGNMVIEAVELLKDPKILGEERARTKFILIDEFQDSNFGQIELVQRLGGEEANIFAVGDPDQAIYRFRGATSAAFDEFRKRFPQTQRTTLSTNYRSVPAVLQTAYAVIKENKVEGREPLVSGRAEAAKVSGESLPGFPPEVVVTPDAVTEAKYVADAMVALQSETNCEWRDFAVLYRLHEHRSEVVAELNARGIPYQTRNTDLLCAPEVRDAIAAMRAVRRPEDAVSYFRVAAMAKFKLDAEELRLALSHAKRGAPMELMLREVRNGKRVLDALEQARNKLAATKDAFGALRLLTKEFSVAGSAELQMFFEFVSKWQEKPITEAPLLDTFLEYLDCFIAVGAKVNVNADGDESTEIPDAVQLMTAHSAKGLEFKHVFVIRANSGSFPSGGREPLFEFPWALSKSLLSPDEIPEHKELHKQEERRLFYVACTRAEDALGLYGKLHWQGKNPTGYLKELLTDRSVKGVIRERRVADSRVDLHARAEGLTQVSEWVLHQPQQLALEQLRLSASAIDCYSGCGLKYWLRHVWKLPEEPAAALQYGSVIHNVLRGYYDAVKAGRTLSKDDLIGAFRDMMQNAHLEDQYQLKLYLAQGERQLAAFAESREGKQQPKVLATEDPFKFELDGVIVQGRMDRVDEVSADAIAIQDYKTGKAKSEKFAEDSLQLTIYALAAKKAGKRAAKVSIYNLENDTVIEVERSDKDLADGERAIKKAAKGIREGEFAPKPSFACKWCAYASICPAKEERVIAIAQASAAVQ